MLKCSDYCFFCGNSCSFKIWGKMDQTGLRVNLFSEVLSFSLGVENYAHCNIACLTLFGILICPNMWYQGKNKPKIGVLLEIC